MEFITQNNVLIEGHNMIVRIPSKSGIVRVKAHELPCVGDPTIRFMVGKAFKKECVGGFGMMCVMQVLAKYEPKEVKCIRQVLEEFPDVMPEELPEYLPPRKRVDHAIEVVATPLWPSVGVKPNTSKVGDLDSFGTPECLELDSKAQNTSY
jgi:hypothetical protein